MYIKELIAEILENYHNQQELYLKMAEWSRQQLDLLEQGDWGGDKLNQLLEQRQGIIAEIDVLSKQNRQAQLQVNDHLGLEAFMLSTLESHLQVLQYQSLREVLIALGKLLAEISEMDRQSNNLIRRKIENRKNSGRRNSHLVQSAYQEAMQQGNRSEES